MPNRALQGARAGQIDADCPRERVAVGEINEAKPDEAHQHEPRVEARPKQSGPDAPLQNAFEVLQHGCLSHSHGDLRDVRSVLEIFPQKQAHELGVIEEKTEIRAHDISQSLFGIGRA